MPFKVAVNTYAVFQFVRELTRSWDEMEAYKLGIIDEKGNVLKKSKDLKTSEEKSAYTMFHRLIWNVKRMLEALPGGASKIKSYAAALWLLKENRELIDKVILENMEYCEVNEARMIIEECSGPTNVSAGVAKKDMPLKKKKKDEEDEMETSITTLRRKIEEGKSIKKVVRAGKVKKKITCAPGQIVKNGKCVQKTALDKQRFIKAAKKRKRSMAGKSTAAAQRKRKKSVRKRSGTGI